MKKRSWILLAVLLAAGLVVFPVAAYVIGGRVVGPYAGPRGLASYLGAIYADAGRGSPLALLMLAGPLVGLGAWPVRSWLLRRAGQEPADG